MSNRAGKFYHEFVYGDDAMQVSLELIEKVAKQMCIVAGLDPDAMVQAADKYTQTVPERNIGYTSSQEVWVPGQGGMTYGAQAVTMERRMMPGYEIVNAVYPIQRWKTYRPAAYEALLGFYAVKQVLLAGEPVRPDPHPELDDDDDDVDMLRGM